MHQAAMQSSGVEGTYVIRDLIPEDIDAFVAELREGRYTGCNVTTPYKAVMAARCDLPRWRRGIARRRQHDHRPRRTAARRHHGRGRLRACAERELDVAAPGGHRAGPGRGRRRRRGRAGAHPSTAAPACASRLVATLRPPTSSARLRGSGDIATVPWDRDAIAATLARTRRSWSTPRRSGSTDLPFDPRALPRSVQRRRPALPSASRSTWSLLRIESGHRASDGLEMLLQQGLLSFEIWTGRIAPAGAVRSALLRAVEA